MPCEGGRWWGHKVVTEVSKQVIQMSGGKVLLATADGEQRPPFGGTVSGSEGWGRSDRTTAVGDAPGQREAGERRVQP